MRSNRRRNWFLKRIALGLAVAAIAAPVAQARVDEGSTSGSQVAFNAGDYGMPRALPSDYAQARGDQIEVVRAQGRSTGSDVVAADYGMPRAMPNDYALSSGDQIEAVRALPRGSSSDKIEFVRTQPREIGEPQLASRFVAPGSTTGDEQTSWNVNWEDAGTGLGLALVLVLLGGGAVLASRQLGHAQTA